MPGTLGSGGNDIDTTDQILNRISEMEIELRDLRRLVESLNN